MLIVIIRKKKLDTLITKAIQAGYELGKADKDKGIIIAGVVNYQVNEILRKGG